MECGYFEFIPRDFLVGAVSLLETREDKIINRRFAVMSILALWDGIKGEFIRDRVKGLHSD